MLAHEYFTADRRKLITDAISAAEKKTSGEIRVHIENRCPEDVLDHAAFIFEKLDMHKTQLRNGVLIYLALHDHKFAILGDSGINQRVPMGFWSGISEQMKAGFKTGRYAETLAQAIRSAGNALSQHFPRDVRDINELSNDISFGNQKQPGA